MTSEFNPVASNTTLLTASEAAEYLRIPLGSLYVRISKKQLPCTRLGRLLRFRKTELDKLMAENSTGVAQSQEPSTPKAV